MKEIKEKVRGQSPKIRNPASRLPKEQDVYKRQPLDILFERLEMRNPESIAVKQYAICLLYTSYYKQGPYKIHPMGAEILFLELEKNESGSMYVQVTDAMAESWKVPKAELFKIALENTQNSNQVKFQSMNEAMDEIFSLNAEGDFDTPMHILSNENNQYGATVALYPDVLKEISKQIGSDYYILPSSCLLYTSRCV